MAKTISKIYHSYISFAQKVIDIEVAGLNQVKENLDESFASLVQHLIDTESRLVIMGIGKSGIIGQKIASTLASTGTNSTFIHPTEALHGDLGQIQPSDTILMISNSGETEELLQLCSFFKNSHAKIVALTGNKQSSLAKNCDWVVNTKVDKEACPEQLAPTSSTTACLAIGDALSMTLMKYKNFKSNDFARLHPGGYLGKKLLTKAKDLISKHSLPMVDANSYLLDVIEIMTKSKLGMCLIEFDNKVGLVTDGDLRRTFEKFKDNITEINNVFVKDVATLNPKSINMNASFEQAEKMMLKHKITNLLVHNDSKKIIGVIQIYSLST